MMVSAPPASAKIGDRPVYLLTDFGLSDPYVGLMKAQMAAIAPLAPQIDLSHGLAQGDLLAARFWLENSLPYLSSAGVICVVVDPTVGSQRKALLIIDGNRAMLAPENGLLARYLRGATQRSAFQRSALERPALERSAFQRAALQRSALHHPASSPSFPPTQVYLLDHERLRTQLPALRARVGRTFDGRDLFAPAAALLASCGAQPEALHKMARLIAESVPSLDQLSPEYRGEDEEGDERRDQRAHQKLERARISVIDHFGNLITDAPVQPGWAASEIRLLGKSCRWVSTYADGNPQELLALAGSFGTLEIAVNCGSAAALLALDRKQLEPGKLDEQSGLSVEIRSLQA